MVQSVVAAVAVVLVAQAFVAAVSVAVVALAFVAAVSVAEAFHAFVAMVAIPVMAAYHFVPTDAVPVGMWMAVADEAESFPPTHVLLLHEFDHHVVSLHWHV